VIDPAGSALHVSVDALAPEGGTLRVFLGKQLVNTLALAPGVRARASWDVASPSQDSYVRIDIERRTPARNRPAISLLSNPVLIDVGPQRESWR